MPAPPETGGARIRKYCRARVPPSFRDQIRIEAAVRGKSVSIYECRPPWHPNLTEWSKVRVAQLRYGGDTHHWSLYWADRNGRWHRYDEMVPGPVDKLLRDRSRPNLHLLGLAVAPITGIVSPITRIHSLMG